MCLPGEVEVEDFVKTHEVPRPSLIFSGFRNDYGAKKSTKVIVVRLKPEQLPEIKSRGIKTPAIIAKPFEVLWRQHLKQVRCCLLEA
jgi:hypothetical protein